MKILLIWEEIPERTKLFTINDPTDKQIAMLEEANGKYINIDDANDGMEYLNWALMDKKYKDAQAPEYTSVWADNQTKTQSPIQGPIDRVYISGFYL
jgi:hypothetical protein